MPWQSVLKPHFRCKLLILNKITARPDSQNHFKTFQIVSKSSRIAAKGLLFCGAGRRGERRDVSPGMDCSPAIATYAAIIRNKNETKTLFISDQRRPTSHEKS